MSPAANLRGMLCGLLALAVSGCAGGAGLPGLGVTTGSVRTPVSSTEVYTRIARGALACWFAAEGPLGATHIFHADALPEAKGGGFEILINERLPSNQRGLKAFRIAVGPGEASATGLRIENLKLSPALARQLRADVLRWSDGGIGCTARSDGWAPTAEPPESAAKKKPAAKVRKKTRSPGTSI
ncbi:MAG: hypothetical protein KDJ41_08440 [Hyphomicrobiaceae bacterium]|nr:hypothetical protein [Hyphomicrobiaceae bacterium]